MSFKENLFKKIEINRMAEKVLNSIGPPGSERKVDKETMRRLLEMSDYQYRRMRDVDLYIQKGDTGLEKILVLDNELAIYRTTPEDVALRKSPRVKEIMNIRNIFKIMNDKDVVVSKREASLDTIQQECIDMLDLSFDITDLEEIEKDGSVSLDRDYTDGVLESLSFFAELLGYIPAPMAFKISHHHILGSLSKKETGELLFGPMVIYSMIHNTLRLIDEQIGSYDKAKIEHLHCIASGKEEASIEGHNVFKYLKKAAAKQIR
jgi:hypothetical protein